MSRYKAVKVADERVDRTGMKEIVDNALSALVGRHLHELKRFSCDDILQHGVNERWMAESSDAVGK